MFLINPFLGGPPRGDGPMALLGGAMFFTAYRDFCRGVGAGDPRPAPAHRRSGRPRSTVLASRPAVLTHTKLIGLNSFFRCLPSWL